MLKLFVVIGVVLASSPVAWAVSPLTNEQITNLLTERTFKIATKKGGAMITYFDANGRYVEVLQQGGASVNYRKNGGWRVLGPGVLCFDSIRYTTHRKKRELSCGKVVKNSATVFQRYDEDGKLHSTLTYVGDGKQLP